MDILIEGRKGVTVPCEGLCVLCVYVWKCVFLWVSVSVCYFVTVCVCMCAERDSPPPVTSPAVSTLHPEVWTQAWTTDIKRLVSRCSCCCSSGIVHTTIAQSGTPETRAVTGTRTSAQEYTVQSIFTGTCRHVAAQCSGLFIFCLSSVYRLLCYSRCVWVFICRFRTCLYWNLRWAASALWTVNFVKVLIHETHKDHEV